MLLSWKASSSSISQRWIFVFMTFLALWLCSTLRVIISITITEMVVPVKENFSYNDQTCPNNIEETRKNHTVLSAPIYNWDEYTQGMILSSYFWGYAVTQLPMGAIIERFGGKHAMGLGILIPAILSYLIPFCINWGDSTALIVIRIIMGMASGAIYPATSNLLSHWSTLSERTTFGSLVYAGAIAGLVFGTTVPALIIKYLPGGWPLVFHYFGIMGMAWFPLWTILCYNNPRQHPFISDSELKLLEKDRDKKEDKKSPPWGYILSSKQFWACAIGLLGHDWAFYTMTNDLPLYMSRIVKFSIESNGYLSALPYLSMWFFILVSSWLANLILKRNWLSKTNMRKIFAMTSLLGPAIFILGASFAGCNQILVVLMFVTGMAFMGSAYPSLMVNNLDLSPNFAGILMAIGNSLATVAGILAPYIVGVLTPNQTIEEWKQFFYIGVGVAIACSIYIATFMSAEVQEWNDPDFVKNKNEVITIQQR